MAVRACVGRTAARHQWLDATAVLGGQDLTAVHEWLDLMVVLVCADRMAAHQWQETTPGLAGLRAVPEWEAPMAARKVDPVIFRRTWAAVLMAGLVWVDPLTAILAWLDPVMAPAWAVSSITVARA